MHVRRKAFITAAALCVLAGSSLPVAAQLYKGVGVNNGGYQRYRAGGLFDGFSPGSPVGSGGSSVGSGSSKGAPGPIAGAGLPFLILAGGYALVRRYRHRGRAE